jgi:hypothetical protein
MKNLIKKFTESHILKVSGVLFILLLVTGSININAQPVLTVYSDASKNTVSDGLFIRSAFLGNYGLGNYQLKAALQTNLINGNNIVISGYRFDGSREFKLKNTLLELNGFGLWTAYTGILQETNFGCLMAMKSRHFDVQFGTNFRTYSFRKDAVEKYEIANDATKIHENFNLMYSFGYNLKPSNHKWNAGLAFTNIDYFMINQETNPYVNLKGFFKVSSSLHLFAEVWYKTAGAINRSSNYFGFLMRGGIVWNFN